MTTGGTPAAVTISPGYPTILLMNTVNRWNSLPFIPGAINGIVPRSFDLNFLGDGIVSSHLP